MIRTIAINIVTLIISVVVALLLSELLVRMVAPQKMYRFPQYMFVNHETADYALAPNFSGTSKTSEYDTSIETNSMGLRESREFGENRDGMIRVVAIGDSFTMGVGVQSDETFLARAEQALSSDETTPDFEIINLGVPGHRTGQSIALLEDVGLSLQPDVIVLNFYVGNDLSQNASPSASHVVNGYIRSKQQRDGLLPSGVRDFLQLNSHLYQLVWPLQRQIFDPDFAEKQAAALRRHFKIYSTNEENATELWQPTKQLLLELKSIAAEANATLIITIIPEDLQIDADAWQNAVSQLQGGEDDYDLSAPMKAALEVCEEIQVSCHDMLPVLSERADASELYFPVDGHWTALGNRVSGDALAAILEAEVRRSSPVVSVDHPGERQ